MHDKETCKLFLRMVKGGMRTKWAGLILITSALLALGGCASIKSAIHEFTPEISVGVFKDGGSGVTVGVKLGGGEQPTATKAEEPNKEGVK
jgi:hypothetical protein